MTPQPFMTNKLPRRIIIVIILAIGGIMLLAASISSVAAQPDRLTPPRSAAEVSSISYPNCRFGVGGAIGTYNVSTLNFGWYMDWSTQPQPPRPGGVDYVQVVRVRPGLGGYTYSPPITTIYTIMDHNPGAIWLIGNEPDSPFQDRLLPETYALAYHDLYQALKQHDPSAQIGVGSIVQPTPLRFQYLDRVLNYYKQQFGAALPADLWSLHTYILREIDPADPESQYNGGPYEVWGAYIPPGMTQTRGELYSYSQMFDVALFQQRLITFRTWLRDRGYRDTPLYITEYGTLFPYPPYNPFFWVDEFGVAMTEARTASFMTATFNVLRTLADPSIGYPADGNRLVQRWLWYSLDDTAFGGLLFDPISGVRRPLGDVFANYTQAITPSVDLLAVRLNADPIYADVPTQTYTTTLHALFSNIGNISITRPITIGFYTGQPLSGTLIGSQVVTSGLNGCAATMAVTMTLPDLPAGAHPIYVHIDPGGAIDETNESNNTVSGFALIATQHILLPLIARN